MDVRTSPMLILRISAPALCRAYAPRTCAVVTLRYFSLALYLTCASPHLLCGDLWHSAPTLCLAYGSPHLHCVWACEPAGIDNFQTSIIPQTIRLTDLIMRQRDLDSSVDPSCNAQVSP